LRLSDILHASGREEENIEKLWVAKEHQMNDVNLQGIFDRMAEHYFTIKDWENALKFFQKSQRIVDDSWQARLRIGQCYEKLG
jgi:tetratricopeptide (TPR) repeat protein